ncbi:MAG TPA: T9SS type A sorting domain-containing protein [Candidatus Deferrimicrobium sp.]|nr:T9SS type A sorting domain-containing protein [Candidatus Deferrimicrobium sp.]
MAVRSRVFTLSLALFSFILGATSATARPPVITSCPDTVFTGTHCDSFYAQIQAVDFDWPGMINSLRYRLLKGPGQVDPLTGEWSYRPSGQDAGKTFEVEIAADDGASVTSGAQACRFEVNVTLNYPPHIGLDLNECGDSFEALAPDTTHVYMYAYDFDRCDQLSTFIERVTPEPAGRVFWRGGMIFEADSLDADKTFLVVVASTDGIDTTRCEITCVTKKRPVPKPFEVRIEMTLHSIQGQREYVDVTMTRGSERIGGFELLMTYDRSVLNFQTVSAGDLHVHCGWEYMTHRFWFSSTNKPHGFWAGLIRVFAMADMNDGSAPPICFMVPTPFRLFTIDFMVTDNRLFECHFSPVRFFWRTCGDNAFWSRYGDTVFLSDSVYAQYGGLAPTVISHDDTFPTYHGDPDACVQNHAGFGDATALRLIEYYNGGAEILCADWPDPRGDVNLNGVAVEVADLVLLSNYLVYGSSVFRINLQGQVHEADMNFDSAVGVADFVYGVRVIKGEQVAGDPFDSTSPNVAQFIDDTVQHAVEVVTSDTIGAVKLVFEGEVTPSLSQPEVETKYAVSQETTGWRTIVLIYSLEGNSFTEGPVVSYGHGRLLSAEAATYTGVKMRTQIETVPHPLPTNFVLPQNYPNPFNSHTVIAFGLPKPSQLLFEIVNVLGQVVYHAQRQYDAGWHDIEWDGADDSGQPVASGVYWYRLTAGEFSDSRRMILLR